MTTVELLPINRSGAVSLPAAQCPDMLAHICRDTAVFYESAGFEPPWTGYVSVSDGRPVGGGGFKGSPRGGRAEIAYWTLPEFERRGFATATARELIRIARVADPTIVLAAQTLPTPNASNAPLRKLGFTFHGTVAHPEDGNVWEWRLEET